jgi:2-octaprenylphenol hydroxylase
VSNPTAAVDFDIAIVGGGMVGLTLAALLADGFRQHGCARRIAVLESHPPQPVANDAPLDLRVSAISPASRAILRTIGAWDLLPANRISPYESMCVWQSGGYADHSRSIRFAAAEVGAPDLGHIAENRAIRNALWARVEAAPAVDIISDQSIECIYEQPEHCCLELADGRKIRAALLVGADGARSLVRSRLDVGFREHSYGQSAIVAHIATGKSHDATAWQCFLPGGPVAMLPLADGRSSLVWSCPEARAQKLLQLDKIEFAHKLENIFGSELGTMECSTERASFPLGVGHAERYTGRRFALVGDAAHRVHPLAGQGVNLGLLDAAVLADVLLEHAGLSIADMGDPLVLRRYERARKGDNLVTLATMDLLNRIFSGPARDIAGAGLEFVNDFEPLKQRLAAYAMGQGRDLPSSARP